MAMLHRSTTCALELASTRAQQVMGHSYFHGTRAGLKNYSPLAGKEDKADRLRWTVEEPWPNVGCRWRFDVLTAANMVGWLSQRITRQCHGTGHRGKATDGRGFVDMKVVCGWAHETSRDVVGKVSLQQQHVCQESRCRG